MDWLAFSLSNQHCFLDSLSSSSHDAHLGMVAVQGADRENAAAAPAAGPCGLKLENFLGGGGCELPARIPGNGAEANTSTGIDNVAELVQIVPLCHQDEVGKKEAEPRKAVDSFGQRTSIYRGVTKHRWTGRYEAHLWDNSCRREGQSRKGRQVYLGGYDKEENAARAYDLAALKYWGPNITTNFPVSLYEKELEEMESMTRQEFVASLRRKSSGFSRGASIYRGVTRHHQHGRWQARIGRVAGNKDLYLGTFTTQEEAAEAYDIAAIKFRGANAVTNFDVSRYDVKSIVSGELPVGGKPSRLAASPPFPAETTSSQHDYWSLISSYQAPVNVDFPLPASVEGPESYFWNGDGDGRSWAAPPAGIPAQGCEQGSKDGVERFQTPMYEIE